jgi:hypothetical protein
MLPAVSDIDENFLIVRKIKKRKRNIDLEDLENGGLEEAQAPD